MASSRLPVRSLTVWIRPGSWDTSGYSHRRAADRGTYTANFTTVWVGGEGELVTVYYVRGQTSYGSNTFWIGQIKARLLLCDQSLRVAL